METSFVVLSVLSNKGAQMKKSGHFEGYTKFHCHPVAVADP